MKYNNETFINKAREVHGDKYDYSKVDYKNTEFPVTIICPTHGEFSQKPHNHISGCGCPNCRKNIPLTTDSLIKKATEIHNGKYDYTKTNFINGKTPIIITCPKHGDFKQMPYDHLSGRGCQKCGEEERTKYKTKTQDEYINQVKNVHGNKYDYSKIVYNGADKMITVICPKHGEFSIKASNFLNGQGCSKCYNERRGNTLRHTKEEYIEKLKEIWGDTYDFSKFEYKNNHTKACIICHTKDKDGVEHGEFWTKPIDLLNGHGCPKCARLFNKSETFVLDELKKVYKNVIPQYKEKWMQSKTSYQTIDIFLPDYNIGIEYQGAQHFQPSKRFGGELGYEKCINRDIAKYNKCKEHGIKLFYISFEKNIPTDYIDYVYTSLDDLIKAINNYIKNKIQLTENDLKKIITEIINKIMYDT